MSEPKRANLITVDSAKGEKKKVTKTTRLDIDLFHSNEKEYPAFNYKELVRFEERKSNGVTQSENPTKNCPQGLDPFSDNDEDVERIAKQFEQKYGSASTYGKTKGRSKEDDYADIGAGYDENDSFIDNTDGYDEMIPPEADTAYGGFYINCGALEFTSVPYQHDENEDPNPIRRNNKRAISSSTSGDESSESSGSESDTTEEPEKPTDIEKKSSEVPNGIAQHKSSEERKKSKSEKHHEKKRHKRVRREAADPNASHKDAQSKMEVDDAQPVTDGGSADQEMSTDSRTSDSALSKPAPSSDNAATSESSREAAGHSGSEEGVNVETALPVEVSACVESIRTVAAETRVRNHGVCNLLNMQPRLDNLIKQLDNLLRGCRVGVRRSAWGAAARAVGQGRARLQKQARLLRVEDTASISVATSATSTAVSTSTTAAPTSSTGHVGAVTGVVLEDDTGPLQNTEAIMLRLKKIINTMRPTLIHNYNQECQRIHDANKKIAAQNAATEDDRRIPERRLPKRTFPWNEEVRLLLSELVRSCGATWVGGGTGSREEAAAVFLRDSVLPLFPQGFVRMPTLLQQASLSKDQKIPNTDAAKRYKVEKIYPSTAAKPVNTNSEVENVTPYHLAASTIAPDKHKTDKVEAPLNSILSSLNLPANTNVTIEKTSKQQTYREDKAERPIDETRSEKYTPPNSIGCITITPVNNTQRFDTKTSKIVNSVTITASPPKGPDVTEIKGIRVKSPSELMKPANTVSGKDDKIKQTSVTAIVSKDRDDTTKKDKHHTSKHKSSHDKVKHSHRTESPNPESQNSKEIRKSVENSNVSKSDSTTKGDGSDFTKKKTTVSSKSANEKSIKFDNGIKFSKTEQNEINRVYATDRVGQNATDNFVKPTDKKRPDSNSKSYKIRDDSIKVMSDKDPLSEIIMDVSDSSSDVELIEEIPPIQNIVYSTKTNPRKDEKSQKTEVIKKNVEAIRKDLVTTKQVTDVLVKQNTIASKTDLVLKTLRKDSDGFVEPVSKRSKSGHVASVAVVSASDLVKNDRDLVKSDKDLVKSDRGLLKSDRDSVKSDRVMVKSDRDLVKSDSSAIVCRNHVNEKVSEYSKKEDDISDINHYDINKVMQDLKELQKSQEVPSGGDVAGDMFYSRTDKKNHDKFSAPHFDMFQDSSNPPLDNKCDPKSLENSNHSVTSG